MLIQWHCTVRCRHFNYHVDKSGEKQNLPIDTAEFATEWAAAIRGRKHHPSILV